MPDCLIPPIDATRNIQGWLGNIETAEYISNFAKKKKNIPKTIPQIFHIFLNIA